MNSDQLFEKSLQFVPGGVHSPVRSFSGLKTTPRFMKWANGAYIYDEEDNKYIDFCMSFGPLIHGHANLDIKEKIIEAVERGWTYGACEKYSLELAEYMVERLPFADQVRFMSSGTEAVMTALRIARGYTGKQKIIKFNGCYHGHLDSMLIKSGSGLAGTATASSAGVTDQTASDTLVCELGDLSELERVFQENSGDIAGVIIEPLPANYGLLVQDQSYLEAVQKLCQNNNALLIFDEVISGFRIGFGGMAMRTGINPDLVTYGKIIGGGMPVGAVCGRRDVMEKLAPIGPVYQAGTLSANPVAMAAGLANMKKLTPEFYSDLNDKSQNIRMVFKEWFMSGEFSDYHIKHFDSLMWFTPTDSVINNPRLIPSNSGERFAELFDTLLKKGVYIAPNGYEVGFMSSAHDDKVCDDLKERLWRK